jgi:hypothetical protein
MGQLAERSWSHFCYSPLITRGSAGRVLMVTLRLLSTHHRGSALLSTTGHTSVTLHSSTMDQLAEHSWSHFCYSPLIISGSAGREQLVTLLLFSIHHPCVSWRSTLATLLLLSTHHPWVNWQGNPHLVETKTINSFQLKSIFYIFSQILRIEKVTQKYGGSHNIQVFNLDTFKKAVISLAKKTVVGTYQKLFDQLWITGGDLLHFYIFFEAAIVSSQDVVMSNWIENQDLAGYEFTQNIIFFYNTNELRCAARCSFHSQCISWTYSGSNCIGYNSIFTGLGYSLLSGTARYYIRHDCGRYLFF